MKIEIEIPDNLIQIVENLELVDPVTGDEMTAKDVMEMLADDLRLVWERPGSWEGANMQTTLEHHGLQDWPIK